MKSKNNIREFTHQFYRGNVGYILLSLIATALMVAANLLISYLMQTIVDFCAGINVGMTLVDITLLGVVCFGIVALSYLFISISQPRFKSRAMEQYKNYVFDKITKKGVSAFSGENSTSYISVLSNDCASIENGYLTNIFNIIDSTSLLVGALVLMIYYSPLLTLISILLSIIPLIAAILTGNTMAKAEKDISNQNEAYMSTLKDSLTGFSVIKSFKAEKRLFALFMKKTRNVARGKEKRDKLSTLVNMISMGAGIIVQLGVFIVGAYLASIDMGISPGIVIVFVQLLNFVVNPLGSIPQALAQINSSKALISKTSELLSQNVKQNGTNVPHRIKGDISVQDLSFSYDKEKKVLDSISFNFDAGKSYAIVGASGSGKSTLLNLLMCGYDSYDGSITYDGHEVRDISSDSLYDTVSLIQQNVFIFNSTIKDNITMFQSVPEDELERAIRLSGLDELIKQRGSDFLCGESGCFLSGGEKQRISIARSLLKHSGVLLIDEATAALDSETALKVSSAILDIDGVTKIAVTHDLDRALLERYDCILTLKQGRIEEAGNFDELMASRGYFYSLFTVAQ